jgi:hypothetical protein
MAGKEKRELKALVESCAYFLSCLGAKSNYR